MTLLGFLNFYIFQWFFFRIYKKYELEKVISYGVMFPIVPMTGYYSKPYKPKNYRMIDLYRCKGVIR